MYVSFKTALPDKNDEIYKPEVAVATNKTLRKVRCSLLQQYGILTHRKWRAETYIFVIGQVFLKHATYADLNTCNRSGIPEARGICRLKYL